MSRVLDDSFDFHIDYAVPQNLREKEDPTDFVIEIRGATQADATHDASEGQGDDAMERVGDVRAYRIPADAPIA